MASLALPSSFFTPDVAKYFTKYKFTSLIGFLMPLLIVRRVARGTILGLAIYVITVIGTLPFRALVQPLKWLKHDQQLTLRQQVILEMLTEIVSHLQYRNVRKVLSMPVHHDVQRLPKQWRPTPVAGSSEKKIIGYWYGATPTMKDKQCVVLYYIHGGGYATGEARMYCPFYLRWLTQMAKRGIDLRIFALEYTLAPEAKLPTQIYEAADGYEYLIKTLQLAPHQIFVGGESAGAHCTMALSGLLSRTNRPPPAGFIYISPYLCAEVDTRSDDHPDIRDYLTLARANEFLALHTPAGMTEDERLKNYLHSPMQVDTRTVGAPAIVTYAEKERLAPQIKRWIGKAKTEHYDLTIDVHPQLYHAYQNVAPLIGNDGWFGIDRLVDWVEHRKYAVDCSNSRRGEMQS